MNSDQVIKKAESILSHHGVKGMKWGTRRGNKKVQKLVKAKTHKQIKGLDEQQLRLVIQRMQLEKQYRDLHKATRNEGRAFALELGKSALSGAVTASAGVVGKEMTSKLIASSKSPSAKKAKTP